MSRVGNKPVPILSGVEVTIEGSTVKAKGPKGELLVNIDSPLVKVEIKDNEVVLTRVEESQESRSRHGLYRSLVNNAIAGVSEGFSKTMEIKGVGYRAALKGNILELNLGYSHSIEFKIPEGVEIQFAEKNNNVFTVSGIDKQLVGQTAADIREFRKPEPYKGKGIRYIDEYILRKAGKTAAK